MNATALISIGIIALVTAVTRYSPFLIFSGRKKTGRIIDYLGRVLTYAIMGMLVVFCLKNISFTSVHSFLPELLASAVTVLMHVWKRNTLLSIGIGTLAYMVLVQFVL